ncbi:hypothetical protein BWI17_18110 [Betaproteobacteria bacterium GR16-43]|nr:hypothetical protein BWI17_18110 [Betaproteobacteria bacterium GR16-43]
MSIATLIDSLGECYASGTQLRDAEFRSRLASHVAALARLSGSELVSRAPALSESLQLFRRLLNRDQEALLDNALEWTDADREFAQWAANTTWRWCAVAATASEAAAGNEAAPALVSATLCAAGDSVKWHAIAAIARPNGLLARASRVLCLAEEFGIAETDVPVEADGTTVSRTAPQLYSRALLLGFLASGNLTRQQVEIADAWITRWARDYALSRTPPASGTSLWVDVTKGHGLRAGERAEMGDLRYLVLEALPRQLMTVERGFHAGRIFPGTGVSTKLRIEEHIVVLDHLHRLVEQLRAKAPTRRAERTLVEGATVEAFVGVHEIVERAMYAPPTVRAPRALEATLVDAGGPKGEALTNLQQVELPRRWMGLADVSEGGLGLVAQRGEHEDICVGDLIAIADGGALAVGEVMRRAPQGTTGSLIGVQVRSRSARPVRLTRLASAEGRGGRDLGGVFVPGPDACGRGDAIVVSEGAYDPRAKYQLAFEECVFVIALNRVRRQGRGWISCGYEVLEQQHREAA